ncbi:transketolase [Petroclostridium sp. X23]|uniref:transketolase n=1 Tax=Petroclostridium sp. X23 TaxID=3045146 RepID=UPI0024ACFCB6|nr:transketolase [Petroclostridium sp. X23]WHH60819.1 transketolase [Petroclostridium sp. X23]
MESHAYKELKIAAAKIRMDIIESLYCAGSGHPGGSLSIADILAVLYFKEMNINAENPEWPERDRFVLSKGHCAPAYYAALAEKGYFSRDELKNLRKGSSFLQGHPDMKKTPGVDMSSGSLGLGLSAANGMAMIGKAENKDYHVYAMLGDGEIQEGQIWEAAMTAAHYKLDNLTAFVDLNGLQIDGEVAAVMNPAPVDKKFAAFGWHVIVIDGHHLEEIIDAIEEGKRTKGRPTAILCRSIKGKGVSFMENKVGWHGMTPNKEQYDEAVKELEQTLRELEVG